MENENTTTTLIVGPIIIGVVIVGAAIALFGYVDAIAAPRTTTRHTVRYFSAYTVASRKMRVTAPKSGEEFYIDVPAPTRIVSENATQTVRHELSPASKQRVLIIKWGGGALLLACVVLLGATVWYSIKHQKTPPAHMRSWLERLFSGLIGVVLGVVGMGDLSEVEIVVPTPPSSNNESTHPKDNSEPFSDPNFKNPEHTLPPFEEEKPPPPTFKPDDPPRTFRDGV